MKKLSHSAAAARRAFPFRYTLRLAALLAPLAQGCSDDFPCAATATCRAPRPNGDGGAERDSASDSLRSFDAMGDADEGGTPPPSDSGSPSRDGALDGSTGTDGASFDDASRDRADDGAVLDAPFSDASDNDANFPVIDASSAVDGRMSDAWGGEDAAT
ncbi:MAG: hypothetical protein ABW133_09075, partial [Polyangiaceae bacterium]